MLNAGRQMFGLAQTRAHSPPGRALSKEIHRSTNPITPSARRSGDFRSPEGRRMSERVRDSFKQIPMSLSFIRGSRSTVFVGNDDHLELLEVMGSSQSSLPVELVRQCDEQTASSSILAVDLNEDARAADRAAAAAERIEASLPTSYKNFADRAMLRQAIESAEVFGHLPPLLLGVALNAFVEEPPCKRGIPIVRVGDKVDKFYVVASGAVRVYGSRETGMVRGDHPVILKDIERGGVFNMSSLACDSKSTREGSKCSVVANSAKPTILFSLSRQHFDALVMCELPFLDRLANEDFIPMHLHVVSKLRRAGCLGGCMLEPILGLAIRELCNTLDQRRIASFGALCTIMEQTAGEPFAIVKSGCLTITLKSRRADSDSEVTQRKMSFARGDLVDLEMIRAFKIGVAQGSVHAAFATPFMTLLRPYQPPPPSVLQQALQSELEVHYVRKLLATMYAFTTLTAAELDAVIRRAPRRKFVSDQPVLLAGQSGGQSMFVVFQGSAKAEREGRDGCEFLGRFGVGEQFGAQALIEPPGQTKPRTVSVTAESDLCCLELDREVFGPLLERVKTMLARDVANRNWQLENWGKVSPQDLREGSVLGEGTYGIVCKGEHRSNGKTYAVKAVAKAKVQTGFIIRQIINERELMAASNHPYVCKLAGAYQSVSQLYFIMELVEGGELFELIDNESGTLSIDACLFYTANVLSAVSHLHRLDIAHRDIKTENLLVDVDGYLKLIDLGFAKHLGSGGHAISFCGTPHYMAPEIIQFETHDCAVDLWATGCLFYEMLFGAVPFDYDEDSAVVIYARVAAYANGNSSLLHFPSGYAWKSQQQWHVVDFVRRLLVPDPKRRAKALEASNHALLAAYPALQIERKAFPAPHLSKHFAQGRANNAHQHDGHQERDTPSILSTVSTSVLNLAVDPGDFVTFPGFERCAPWGEEKRMAIAPNAAPNKDKEVLQTSKNQKRRSVT